MDIYKYTPPKQTKNAVIFSAIFFAGAAACLIASSLVDSYRVIYQVSAVILGVVAIQVTTRFILSSYSYVLDGANFIVIRVNGKKATQVCNVTLATAIGLCEVKKYSEAEKKFGKINMRMNFSQNLYPVREYTYVFDFNGKKSTITFDSDAAFAAELALRAGV